MMNTESIPLKSVMPGMLLDFIYTKVDGSTKQYKVLVIDPNKKNDRAKEPQLHAFLIEDVFDKSLKEFIENISADNGLNTDEAYQNFKSSNFVKDRSYRTFNVSGITSVKRIIIDEFK